MHRSLLYKQMLKTTPSSKLMTNEIMRIKKSLWDPCLKSQAETKGTCSMLMAVILFSHFGRDSGGRKRTGSVGASHHNMGLISSCLLMILVPILAQEEPEIQGVKNVSSLRTHSKFPLSPFKPGFWACSLVAVKNQGKKEAAEGENDRPG